MISSPILQNVLETSPHTKPPPPSTLGRWVMTSVNPVEAVMQSNPTVKPVYRATLL